MNYSATPPLTFFYKNAREIESAYSFTSEFLRTSWERWSTCSGKAKAKVGVGDILKMIGLDIGGIQAEGEVSKEDGEKGQYHFTIEQKLLVTLKYYDENHLLRVLSDKHRTDLEIGDILVFQGNFCLGDEEDDVATLVGSAGLKEMRVFFSKEHMPPSVYLSLRYSIGEQKIISGCGSVMSADQNHVQIRPIAFGLSFLDVLGIEA